MAEGGVGVESAGGGDVTAKESPWPYLDNYMSVTETHTHVFDHVTVKLLLLFGLVVL